VIEACSYADASVYSETSLSRAFGGVEPLMDFTFQTARSVLPTTQLVYEDYMSWEPGFESHRAKVLQILEGFSKRNIPVDALGIQAHLSTEKTVSGSAPPRQEAQWRKFLDEVVAMGYGLEITEFDVNDQGLPADIAVRDQAVADYAKAYLDVTLSYKQVKDVLCWGLCDPYSWLQQYKPRADKLENRCTPFDGQFKKKPLYTAIAAALAAAPAR
jgi:endo-1,4-beta-xylanase